MLERYQWVDRAAVAELCVTGTSTRKVHKVERVTSIEWISKDWASAVCEHLDSEAGKLAGCTLAGRRMPYLWVGTTYARGRCEQSVASKVAVTAIGCNEDGWCHVPGVVVGVESHG
ncbi:transposase [Slackia heliotrinireducens]|uniref:transposase n=1 Tax=Slackia heliotrinireducens TaxID=84110 RepID=UPI000F828584|nr:transposase [Slackia heliotrinireducens]